MLLLEAVKANMPIIEIRTTDVLNVKDIIKFYIPNGVRVTGLKALLDTPHIKVGYSVGNLAQVDYNKAYGELLELEKSLVIINPEKSNKIAFDAGELEVPKKMIIEVLEEGGYTERAIGKLLPSLANLDLKQIGELCKLTQVLCGDLTPQSITHVRRMVHPESQGLLQVDTQLDFYYPDAQLEAFITREEDFFLECEQHNLVPRGLLLTGAPGVGKSQAAKYVATKWGVPLFLLDLSSIMGKYVGESEKGMMSMLRKIDAEAPAILLIDEVEKVYKENSDDGTTTRLLGQLLWWLAEHRSRVFTMMTSNNKATLPPELYRPGRIDEVIEIKGLGYTEAVKFVGKIIKHFGEDFEVPNVESLFNGFVPTDRVSHAELVKAVRDAVKSQILKNKEL